MFSEQVIIDNVYLATVIVALITLHIFTTQELREIEQKSIRDDFDYKHWDEAEDFIESELNRMGINTVSDLEDDKDE